MKTLMFYIGIDILALFLFEFGVTHRKKNVPKKGVIYKGDILIFFSACILFIPIAFRSISVGVDTKGYYEVFLRVINDTATISDYNWLGIGYRFIIKIVGLFSNSYILLNSIIGALSLYFLYKSFLENSQNPTMSLFIFLSTTLYYQMFNQARQLLAICIVLYSFKYLKTRNIKKYFLFILLATSIHGSALIMLPIYFIANNNITKKNLALYFIIVIVLYFGFTTIEKLLLYTNYGKIYFGTDYYVTSKSSIINLIFRFAIMVYLLIMSRKMIKKDLNNKELINISIICVLTQILTLKLYIFARITTYFYVFFTLALPNSIDSIENKNNRKIVKIFIIILFITYHFIYYKFMAKSSGVDIYSFIFN